MSQMGGDRAVLAVDVGTSGCRAALYSPDGIVVREAARGYAAVFDAEADRAEADPEEICAAFLEVLEQCCSGGRYRIGTVVTGSFLHSLLLVDGAGRPLTPLSIWADRRAAPLCREYGVQHRDGGWRQKTGCTLSPSYPLWRLLWYREREPELFGSFARAVSIKSFIFHRLFGDHFEDHSLASGTGLFNLHTRAWDRELLDFLGLAEERLPRLLPVRGALPAPSRLLAERLPLLAGATWIAGAGDGPLAHLGSAGASPAVASLTLGTSAAARVTEAVPVASADPATWCYVMDDRAFVSGQASNNCGNVIDWFSRLMPGGGSGWAEVERRLSAGAVGRGPIFLPTLYGERTVTADDGAPAARFTGLLPRHGADDLLRSVVEGVVFNAVSLLERLCASRGIEAVAVSGSLGISPFVRRLLSSLIDSPLSFAEGGNASLLGAYRLTGGEGASGVPQMAAGREAGCNAAPDELVRQKYAAWQAAKRETGA